MVKDLKREDFDLMAPVGSFESLMAAIQAGADSVYLGIGNLNMRARSSINFTENDLLEVVKICKQHHKKVYVTLNVVFFDEELDQLKEIIKIVKEANVDAVIASDPAAIQFAHEAEVEVHASTQLNISNTEAIKFYSGFADVMVLARELNLNQIKYLVDQIEKQNIRGPEGNLVKVEIFAHGALCMSVSGKCYLSLHNHNYSANRGACLQDCRRGYLITEKETGVALEVDNPYILSPKDLCTLHFINKILDTGVKVLKIEGRARSPEYVKTVTECYDQAIKSYAKGDFSKEKVKEWEKKLSTVYNRGFWGGYYLGKKLGEWSDTYGSKATQKKVYAAKNMNYFSNLQVADFLCEAETLKVGDQVLIIGPTTGVIEHTLEEIRVDLKKTGQVKKGEQFSFPINHKIRRSDRLYKIVRKEEP